MHYELVRRDRRIPLRHNLFDEDAIVLGRNLWRGDCLTVRRAERGSSKVSYPDMPYIGFWHMPHAWMLLMYVLSHGVPFHPDRESQEDLEKQENLISLEAGREYKIAWTMEIL